MIRKLYDGGVERFYEQHEFRELMGNLSADSVTIYITGAIGERHEVDIFNLKGTTLVFTQRTPTFKFGPPEVSLHAAGSEEAIGTVEEIVKKEFRKVKKERI